MGSSATHPPSGALRVLALSILVLALLAGISLLTPGARGDHELQKWEYYGVATYALGFDRAQATVFADHNGSVYVFYTTTNRFSGLANLNVTKFATRGSADRPEWRFDRQVNTAQNSVFKGLPPSVATDAQGALYVAYSESRDGLSTEVYVSKSVDGGATWLPEVRASAIGAQKNDHASIAVAADGKIYVAWIQDWGSAYPGDVTAAVSTNGGASFGNVQNISGAPPSSVTSAVSVTTDSMGRAYVLYDDVDFGAGQVTANLTWSDDGMTWSPPQTVSGPKTNLFLPAMKADDEDRLHAAWIDSRGNSNLVSYTRSEDRGATWTVPITISQNSVQEVTGVRTSIGISGGTLMVAWTGTRNGTGGLAYATSSDRGDRWSADGFFPVPAYGTKNAVIAADENGTFYAAPTQGAGGSTAVFLEYWFGPPTAPVVTLFPSGLGELEVRWTGAPEPNVVGYRVWQSADGANYQLIASTGPDARNLTDRGLANGTYWYSVESVNDRGMRSHSSVPVRGVVAVTEEGQIGVLLAEIAALQDKLSRLNDTSSSEAAELKARIAELQARLNALQADNDAPPNLLNVNNILSIAVIVLLAIVLVKQFRRPRPREPIAPEPSPPPFEEPEPEAEPEFEEFLNELQEELEEEPTVQPSVPEFEEEL